MYTTKEAAQRLGISMRRVNALIASGDLEAQRFGRSWMLDERSVHERAERGRTAGRPKMNEKNERNLAPFTLMNRNHPVLDFVYNRRTRETADIVPREGIAWKPLGIGLRERTPNRYDLAAWIASRSIPDMRPNLAPVLRELAARHGIDLMFDSWDSICPISIGSSPLISTWTGMTSITSKNRLRRMHWAKPCSAALPCRNSTPA